MEKFFEHKGFQGSVEWSEPDHVFHGKIMGITSTITYEGNDLEMLEADFAVAVEEYIALCEDISVPGSLHKEQ